MVIFLIISLKAPLFTVTKLVTVNVFSKGVNDSRKMSTYSVKRLSTTSGKRAKTVNQN